ncbi:MAG: helix-turn-helix transcriptional regulator [Leptolyngbya sp. SIO3F4]|nr:helix-turn-helix transcriptional regulator [Leptolyngbya sp. SIO3F4]
MSSQTRIETPSEVLQPFLVYTKSTAFDSLISEQGQVRPCAAPEVTFKNHLIVLPLTGQLRTNFSPDGLTSKRHTCQAGHISIYPAGTSTQCDIEADHDYHYNCLQLKSEAISQSVSEVFDTRQFDLSPQFGLTDPLLESILRHFAQEVTTDSSLDRLYVDSLSNTLFVHLLQRYATRKTELPEYRDGLSRYQLRRAIGYIESHLEQDIKLADIAGLLGMSQYYFCRLFRQSMGVSPYKYVTQKRIERAKRLLRQSQQMSIAEIALDCGFTNQSALCKHFRKLTGTTPKAYRKGA